jgi:two-component system, cell cycle sensor histidine kinase and response regulator CckA
VSFRDSELYRLFDRSPIGMYRCDASGRFQQVNDALARLLGYDSAGDVLALTTACDVHVDPADHQRLLEHRRPDGAVEGARVRWRTRQGREITVQIHGHVVEDGDGVRFYALVLDVTELEDANRELRIQREARATTAATLDHVVRQMPAVYWIVDRDLRIITLGGAVQEVVGYPPGRYSGMTIEDIHHQDGESADSVAMHRRAIAGETVTYTTEYRDKHLAVTVAPHRSGDAIIGAIGTCVELTSHRMLERRLVDAQRAESLGVLAGGLAHDFNSLLVAILGNADLALRELAPRAPGYGALDNIRKAGLRAAELIDQLLAYAGHGGVASTTVAVCPLLDELLKISAPAMPANVGVRVEITRDMVLRGDASQVRQVLLNLINNARDALAARGGTITISGRRLQHDGAPHPDDVIAATAGTFVEIQISDDGPGMSWETRRRIFEPFFTTKPSGHGLGLAAVAGIVRAHGGGLRLVTTPGQGARFQVLWPSTLASTELAAATPGAGQIVLVIDDEDLVRDVVARMIRDLGYAAITATDGPAGLDIVDRLPVDAVLVDLTLPRMTGAAVVDALRARRPELPIIVCSGQARDAGAVRADAYLPKPFLLDSLDDTLARLLPRPQIGHGSDVRNHPDGNCEM